MAPHPDKEAEVQPQGLVQGWAVAQIGAIRVHLRVCLVATREQLSCIPCELRAVGLLTSELGLVNVSIPEEF